MTTVRDEGLRLHQIDLIGYSTKWIVSTPSLLVAGLGSGLTLTLRQGVPRIHLVYNLAFARKLLYASLEARYRRLLYR